MNHHLPSQYDESWAIPELLEELSRTSDNLVCLHRSQVSFEQFMVVHVLAVLEPYYLAIAIDESARFDGLVVAKIEDVDAVTTGGPYLEYLRGSLDFDELRQSVLARVPDTDQVFDWLVDSRTISMVKTFHGDIFGVIRSIGENLMMLEIFEDDGDAGGVRFVRMDIVEGIETLSPTTERVSEKVLSRNVAR
ncbi:MAG: hypothetical protein SFX74_05010 [Fimbriimonadaceae bacterium]|nr:hypothetical protein [Fimbriimonadaceae bacterium]